MSNTQIFFSYAWGDVREEGESREKIVNELYDSLKNAGYNLVRDKVDLGYKGFISDFMKEIGKGNQVIVVISDKYVRSPFCMFELYEVARNCQFDKQIFRERVFPIMTEFIDFARPKVIDAYLSFWEEERNEWETMLKKRMGQLSGEQFARYEKVKLISENIGKMTDWLADMNTLNPTMLSENSFEQIRLALGEPGKSPAGTQPSVNNTAASAAPDLAAVKKKLLDLIDELLYDEFFEAVKNSGCSYVKPTYAQLRNEYVQGTYKFEAGYASRLKTFTNAIKLPENN